MYRHRANAFAIPIFVAPKRGKGLYDSRRSTSAQSCLGASAQLAKRENVFNKIVLLTGLVLAFVNNAHAYCFNDDFLTTPDPDLQEAQISTTSASGRLESISIGDKRFSILRGPNGNIIGTVDRAGKATLIDSLKTSSSDATQKGPTTNVLDPCQMGGDSIILAVAELLKVEITRERVDDSIMWREIVQPAMPYVEMFAPPDPDRVKACQRGLDACVAKAGDGLPLILAACTKAVDQMKVQKPNWGVALFIAAMSACAAAGEYFKKQNTDACIADYASCVANG